MSVKRPTKKQLLRVMKLNKQILKLIPEGDSMHLMYRKMKERLEERYDTYEQFLVNPYWPNKSQVKYNSDEELGLGDYNINEN